MNPTDGRIESLDALRGFALVGILVVNIQMFSGWGFLGDEGREVLAWSAYDEPLHLGLNILAHDKFYSLFSLLFGYSFVMVAGKRGAHYHLRRMLGLGILGLGHALLLWPWDILLLYAVIGVILTPFLHRSASALLFWALALLLAIALGRWYWLVYEPLGDWISRGHRLLGENVSHLASGAYREVVSANWELLQATIISRVEDLRPVRVMAMFLFGAAAAKLQLARPDSGLTRRMLILALIGLPLALGIATAEQFLNPDEFLILSIATETLAGPMCALSYGALLILWWNRGGVVARALRAAFAPAGRMALTNYLGQSLVCVPIFYGFGLGLFGEHSLAKLMLFSGILIGAQLIVSALWLSQFRQGPMEWLWRWQISGSRPPMLRSRKT